MVLRAAGEVGCAHCKMIGAADRACQICTRMICDACAADWATCDQPAGRVIRLGRSARVRDVDPLGRIALVSHWRKPMRFFDLRKLAWIEGIEVSRNLLLWARNTPPRLASDGTLVYAELDRLGRDYLFRGILWLSFGRDLNSQVDGEAPVHGTQMSAIGDRFSYVTDTQRIVVMYRQEAPEPTASVDVVALTPRPRVAPQRLELHTYEPLPRRVIQATCVDGERDLLASSSWGEYALHALHGERAERLGHFKTDQPGDVSWIAVAGPRLVTAVKRSGGTRIEVRMLDDARVPGPVARMIEPPSPYTRSALSRDGRYLAIGSGATLTLCDLDEDTSVTYDEHSDEINYVRFAADDHTLISADTDNRVVMRPRTPTGYAKPLIAVDVPS